MVKHKHTDAEISKISLLSSVVEQIEKSEGSRGTRKRSLERPLRRGDSGAKPQSNKTEFFEDLKGEHQCERDQASAGPRAM